MKSRPPFPATRDNYPVSNDKKPAKRQGQWRPWRKGPEFEARGGGLTLLGVVMLEIQRIGGWATSAELADAALQHASMMPNVSRVDATAVSVVLRRAAKWGLVAVGYHPTNRRYVTYHPDPSAEGLGCPTCGRPWDRRQVNPAAKAALDDFLLRHKRRKGRS